MYVYILFILVEKVEFSLFFPLIFVHEYEKELRDENNQYSFSFIFSFPSLFLQW